MTAATSPVSYPVNVLRLPPKGLEVVVEADDAARAALAETHGVEAVLSYRATVTVRRWRRNGIEVEGRVKAVIRQTCVVTLEPLENRIDEPVEAVFLPEESKLGREGFGAGGEIVLDVDGPDSPEVFSGSHVDVGALAEEFFGLAIDPYPRKSGAALTPAAGDETGDNNRLREQLGKLMPKS